MDGGDGRIRQVIRQAGVEGDDLGIIPLRDLAVVDIHQGLAVQDELGQGDGGRTGSGGRDGLEGNVVDRDNRAGHHGVHLQVFAIGVLFWSLRERVGTGEIDRVVDDGCLAGAGADTVVVDDHGRINILVGVGPLGIDRQGEGCARAGDLDGSGRERS